MTLPELFSQYLRHGKYLKGWSPKTPVVYKTAFTSFQQSLVQSSLSGDLLTKAQLEAWIIRMRQKPLAPACINIYIRSINSFCAWLKEEGHLATEIKIKQVPAPLKPVTAFSTSDINAILDFRDKGFCSNRAWTLIQLLLDTGCRINELLSIQHEAVDFGNVLLTVGGKGGKKRKVPFSVQARKILWRYVEASKRRGVTSTLLFSSIVVQS
jgi:integrase/recombinase XerD